MSTRGYGLLFPGASGFLLEGTREPAAHMPRIAFFPEAAFGPALNSVGIAQA